MGGPPLGRQEERRRHEVRRSEARPRQHGGQRAEPRCCVGTAQERFEDRPDLQLDRLFERFPALRGERRRERHDLGGNRTLERGAIPVAHRRASRRAEPLTHASLRTQGAGQRPPAVNRPLRRPLRRPAVARRERRRARLASFSERQTTHRRPQLDARRVEEGPGPHGLPVVKRAALLADAWVGVGALGPGGKAPNERAVTGSVGGKLARLREPPGGVEEPRGAPDPVRVFNLRGEHPRVGPEAVQLGPPARPLRARLVVLGVVGDA